MIGDNNSGGRDLSLIDIAVTSFRVLYKLTMNSQWTHPSLAASLLLFTAMRRSAKKLGKSLKVLQATSDGHGGSRLLEKKYTPTSPSKKVKPTESPPKSKKQRTDDPVLDFGLDEYPLVEDKRPSDPSSTKVMFIFQHDALDVQPHCADTTGLPRGICPATSTKICGPYCFPSGPQERTSV